MSWALVDPIGKFSWESPDQFPTVKVYCVTAPNEEDFSCRRKNWHSTQLQSVANVRNMKMNIPF